MKKPLRIYADTSVFGGCMDEEFKIDSLQFMDNVRRGRIIILFSEIVLRELEKAPRVIRTLLQSIPEQYLEHIELTEEIIDLRNAYITAHVVNKKWIDDATHVAAATTSRADAIVSWNFKHIVRLDKMKMYNQINLLHGYGVLTIVTPKEVIIDEGE